MIKIVTKKKSAYKKVLCHWKLHLQKCKEKQWKIDSEKSVIHVCDIFFKSIWIFDSVFIINFGILTTVLALVNAGL